MVMQYWGRRGFAVPGEAANAASIYDHLYSAKARGIFGSKIAEYLHAHGFEPYVFAGRWDDLSWHLARGRPLIVCVRSSGNNSALHYLVISGIDEQLGMIVANDSARHDLSHIDRESFEQAWKAAGNWTLLALPETSR
jgi:Peptidase_C39 like family